jgi:quercetin dioxygenase-like cupin family protein
LHHEIDAHHLLLGVLREEASAGASILVSRGLTLDLAREEVARLQQETAQWGTLAELTLKLSGYTSDEQQLFRNVLFDQTYASLPRDPQARVQIYNAEIAPGGYTNWHCHNGATFFIALQGIFEAEFQEGTLIKARAGDVYSEPIARFHRGHNPHPEVAYLCIGVCLTAPDREHVTNAISRPW